MALQTAISKAVCYKIKNEQLWEKAVHFLLVATNWFYASLPTVFLYHYRFFIILQPKLNILHMRTKITLILLVCVLVGCAKNADIESVNVPVESAFQTVLPKISKDISTLSADDAIKVANLFSHGSVLTKSETLKDVRNVVPIKDASDRTLMYAVNYDDGYTIVSATKNYHPVLAVVDHGTYTGEKTGTGQDVLMNEYMLATEAAMDGEITIEGNPWSAYEEVRFVKPAQTRVSEEYYDVVDRYSSEWYNAGYNIYRLNQKPENMPDDMYQQFCEYAEAYDRPDHDYMSCSFIVENERRIRYNIYPMCTTSWGQSNPYNLGLSDTSLPLGCTTIAAAQIMRYMKSPSTINWDAMPLSLSYNQINTTLTTFLAQLRSRIGVDDDGGATISQVYNALTNYYNYDLTFVNTHNISLVESSLLSYKPVYMRGVDSAQGVGHAWVCDGYRETMPQVEYYLYVIPDWEYEITQLHLLETGVVYDYNMNVLKYYHMNWGWNGSYNGYFFDSSISTAVGNFAVTRRELIIN